MGFDKEHLDNMWSYNPQNNTWTQIPTNYPGKGRAQMIAERLNKKIIIGLGTNDVTGGPYDGVRAADIWEYLPELGN